MGSPVGVAGGAVAAARMATPGKRRMPAEALAVLKLRLQEDRFFRRNQLRDLLDPSWPNRPKGQCTTARIEVQAQLTAAAIGVLSDIEAALIRMNTGQYGRCQMCEADIGLLRLRIVPHTRYCARCHRAKETGAGRADGGRVDGLAVNGDVLGDRDLGLA